MSTAKSAKVQAEIEKARVKLAEQQSRIKELEAKHTELENVEIVDIVRGLKIPLDELTAALQSVKGGVAPATAATFTTSGQLGPKSKATTLKNEYTDEEDDSE
jgi:uncharacterized protein YjgD (DUF1641 family)